MYERFKSLYISKTFYVYLLEGSMSVTLVYIPIYSVRPCPGQYQLLFSLKKMFFVRYLCEPWLETPLVGASSCTLVCRFDSQSGLDPWLECTWEATDCCLSLCLGLSPSLKSIKNNGLIKNKINKHTLG